MKLLVIFPSASWGCAEEYALTIAYFSRLSISGCNQSAQASLARNIHKDSIYFHVSPRITKDSQNKASANFWNVLGKK